MFSIGLETDPHYQFREI
jgi:hypothetical protein